MFESGHSSFYQQETGIAEIKDKYEVNFCTTDDGARFTDVEVL